MQNKKPQLAVVVKGYYETKDNTVFGIYLLDKKNVMMIPFDNEFLTEVESVDTMADTVHFLKKQGYKVQFDISEKTNFDVSKYFPSVNVKSVNK